MTGTKSVLDSTKGTIAVLMTCHNRCDKTIACLRSLYDQTASIKFVVYLVDDGSTDGTSEAIRAQFPDVHIIPGDGNLFWAGGMRLAWHHALTEQPKVYLWLNDDVVLDPDALERLVFCQGALSEPALIGGAMLDPISGAVTYGGSVRRHHHPCKFEREDVTDKMVSVDVLNGNLLWVPSPVVERIGIMASYLVHHGGDYEYCLRAHKAGFGIYLAAGTYGTCSENAPAPKVRGIAGIRRALSPKWLPFSMGIPLYRATAGRIWWMWLGAYYLRCFLKGT